MDFKLSEREELLRKSMAEFAQREIAPLVEEMEKIGEFPRSLMKKTGEIGLCGLVTSPQYGGNGMGHMARAIGIEEVSKVSAAVGLALQVHHMACWPIETWGTEEQKGKYLPRLATGETFGACSVTEPSGGSDVFGMQTTAKEEGDYWVINGRKCFCTNSHISDILVVVARTGEDAKGRPAFSAFIVESSFEGFSLGREEHKMGLKGAFTGELVFQDCKVPKENLLGKAGEGLRIGLATVNRIGRPGMASVGVGLCYASLEEASKFAKERVLYGKPISDLQAIQFLLADIFTLAEIARWLTYRGAWMMDQGLPCDTEMTLAKLVATENAFQCARMACDIHGGYSAIQEYSVQRYLRDAWVTIPSGGTSQVSKVVLGRHVLKNF
jgi:alkylation response protein AidB-like acyl-CoA dehydrogenase